MLSYVWDKVFKNGPSEICGRQLSPFLEYFVPFDNLQQRDMNFQNAWKSMIHSLSRSCERFDISTGCLKKISLEYIGK